MPSVDRFDTDEGTVTVVNIPNQDTLYYLEGERITGEKAKELVAIESGILENPRMCPVCKNEGRRRILSLAQIHQEGATFRPVEASKVCLVSDMTDYSQHIRGDIIAYIHNEK